jgi:hypothetical protein
LFSFAVKANHEGLFNGLKAVVEGNADELAAALRLYHALHPGNPILSCEDPNGFKPRESGAVAGGKTMEARIFGSADWDRCQSRALDPSSPRASGSSTSAQSTGRAAQ